MRLSLLMGQPPSVVMGWPASDVNLLAQYLSREPAPAERLEYSIAHLACMYANAHRGKNGKEHKLETFLMFRKAWDQRDRYSDDERSMLDVLDNL